MERREAKINQPRTDTLRDLTQQGCGDLSLEGTEVDGIRLLDLSIDIAEHLATFVGEGSSHLELDH